MTNVPSPPATRLCLGVTGHRESNARFAANREAIAAVFAEVCGRIAACVDAEAATMGPVLPIRLHTLLADGADQLASAEAFQRGWEIVAPLPFGKALNLAINAQPNNLADATALLDGADAADPETRRRAQAIREWYGKARLFELADADEAVAGYYLAALRYSEDSARAEAFSAHSSERVALAGQVMIEQSDILIGIWDGEARNLVGGTGHTIAAALAQGAAVVRIDPANPAAWYILRAPESLHAPAATQDREEVLAALVRVALRPREGGALRAGAEALSREAWHPRSNRYWTGYRRIEAMFGGEGRPFRSLDQSYERPEDIATGSGAAMLQAARALPGGDADFVARIEAAILRRFAWADGISTRLSDAYRGGMIANFLLSAAAIVAGMAYQPLGFDEDKWMFATTEFLLLSAILLITGLGVKWRWHRRWFETRRVAEYFRHAPILLLLGVARPLGRWPKGIQTSWPEYYARCGLRELGLPEVRTTPAYLRQALQGLLDAHVVSQRDYHVAKAKRLTSVHHKLDHLSERLFQLAVASVTVYLVLKGGVVLHLVPESWPHALSKLFTFLGVCFPTFGAAIAGIRYFGDFERFAAISEVTAEKLDSVHARIGLVLSAPDSRLDYASASELAHAMDDIVVSEIENWQAVFGGKQITVPV